MTKQDLKVLHTYEYLRIRNGLVTFDMLISNLLGFSSWQLSDSLANLNINIQIK